jgi:hypothetical protein
MEQFIESVKRYMHATTQSALLLTGEWGSGKTYFVKNTLIKEINKEGVSCIYISLNGIKNSNELIRQILASKLKLSQKVIIGSSIIKSIYELGTIIPGFEKFKDIKISSNKDIINIFNFSKNFLVFDDLERISPDFNIADFLGFINTEFVEHNGYKILFVSNESEIKDTRYHLIKEKIIEHTFIYNADIEIIFAEYVKNISNKISWFYKEYDKEILEFINKYKISNLRTVFSIFNSLNYLIDCLPQEAIKHHHDSLNLFIIAITNEIKIGKITIVDLESTKGLNKLTETIVTKQLLASVEKQKRIIDTNAKNDEKHKSYEEYFCQTYLDNDPHKYVFYKCAFRLLLTGYADSKAINEEINLNPELAPWLKAEGIMTNYIEYDEATVKKAVNDVVKYASEGYYPALSYGYLYYWLSMFAENQVIHIKNDLLIQKLKIGFISSSKKNDFNYESIEREYYAGANTKDNPLSQFINKTVTIVSKKNQIKKCNRIVDILEDDTKMYAYFEENRGYCIFDKINIRKLYIALKKAKSRSIYYFSQHLKTRYNYSNIYDYHIPEIDGITELSELIRKQRISKKKYPLKIIAMNELHRELETLLKKLNKQSL